MSSYLCFYGIKNEERICIFAFGGCSEIYHTITKNISIPFDKDRELTEEDLYSVLLTLDKDIEKLNNKIYEYERHASGSIELVEEILSCKEYREEYFYVKARIYTILDMVDQVKYGKDSFDKIICTIE